MGSMDFFFLMVSVFRKKSQKADITHYNFSCEEFYMSIISTLLMRSEVALNHREIHTYEAFASIENKDLSVFISFK